MPYLLVRHKVADYATWTALFDEDPPGRKDSGSKGGYIFRNADDPQEVVVLLEWDDLAQLRQFAQSTALQEAMQRAGITDQPDVYFLEEVDRPAH